MSNDIKKRKRKKLSFRKIINRLRKAIGWLIEKRYFLLVIIVLILFVHSCFSRTTGFLLALLLLALYIFDVKKTKGVSFGECILVLLLVVLLGLGPCYLKKEIIRWSDKFYNAKFGKIQIPTPWGAVVFETALSRLQLETAKKPEIDVLFKEKEIKQIEIPEEEKTIQIVSSLTEQRLENNLINNGNFSIPLTSNLSKWGHGFYSDLIRKKYPKLNLVWINFLNADINIQIEETEIGNALKIVHSSETTPHKVGIMEQYIKVSTPGKYKFSFWAKTFENYEKDAIWFSTRDDWVSPVTIDQKGPFEWKHFSKTLEIDKTGLITFTIISQGKGTIYLANISLVKAPD